MAKTHTKINQLAGDKLKGFAYANNTDKELVDDILATRDSVTKYTEIAREYDSTSTIDTLTVKPFFLVPTSCGYTTGDGIDAPLEGWTATVDTSVDFIQNQPSFINQVFTGTGLNDLYYNFSGTISTPYSYSVEIVGTNVDSLVINSITGSFNPTDTITGLSSGATATIDTIYTASGNTYLLLSSVVGTFTFGETIEGATPSDTAFVDNVANSDIAQITSSSSNSIILSGNQLLFTTFEDIDFSFFSSTGHTLGDIWSFDTSLTTNTTLVYLDNVVGTIPDTNNQTTITNTTTACTSLKAFSYEGSLIIGETYQCIDFSTLSQEGEIFITGGVYPNYTYIVNSGNVNINSILSGFNVSFAYSISSTPVTTTITTGYESNQITFPGVPFPIDASAMVATDGLDKMAVGVLDLTPFGQSNLVAGILALYDDGSQSTFTTQKGYANLNLFDATTNKSMNVNYSGDEFRVQGFDGSNEYELLIDPTRFRYDINGQQQLLPTTQGTSNQIMRTDGSGNMFWDNESSSSLNAINGLITIGPDILMGGNLTQDTNINVYDGSNTYYWQMFGTDSAGNQTGICYYPQGLNGLTGYAGAYSDVSAYNKAGVYSTGFNQYLAVLGTFDGTGAIQNASYTIHEYNFNTAYASKDTKLVNDNNNWSTYSDFIENTGTNVVRFESFTNTNPSSTANGRKISELINLDTSQPMRQITLQDTAASKSIIETYDINVNFEKITSMTDGFNTNNFKQTATGLESTAYLSSRDDSGTTTPGNFLYTDSNGKFQSAPLGKGLYNLSAYADDTAAGGAGLTTGEFYQTDGTGAAPLNVAGIVMIKQ